MSSPRFGNSENTKQDSQPNSQPDLIESFLLECKELNSDSAALDSANRYLEAVLAQCALPKSQFPAAFTLTNADTNPAFFKAPARPGIQAWRENKLKLYNEYVDQVRPVFRRNFLDMLKAVDYSLTDLHGCTLTMRIYITNQYTRESYGESGAIKIQLATAITQAIQEEYVNNAEAFESFLESVWSYGASQPIENTTLLLLSNCINKIKNKTSPEAKSDTYRLSLEMNFHSPQLKARSALLPEGREKRKLSEPQAPESKPDKPDDMAEVANDDGSKSLKLK